MPAPAGLNYLKAKFNAEIIIRSLRSHGLTVKALCTDGDPMYFQAFGEDVSAQLVQGWAEIINRVEFNANKMNLNVDAISWISDPLHLAKNARKRFLRHIISLSGKQS